MYFYVTFQTIVMFGSFLAVIIKGTGEAGGLGNVFENSHKTNRVEFFKY